MNKILKLLKMRPFSGNVDADRIMLKMLPDNELLSICEMNNKYIKTVCSAEYIWYDRLVDNILKLNRFRRVPLDPEIFIQEIASSISSLYPNITTYKQMYKYLSTFNISLNFLNMITQNIPELYPILVYAIGLKEATTLDSFNITMENGKIGLRDNYRNHQNRLERSVVIIKPEIFDIIKTYIFPLYSTNTNIWTFINSGYIRYVTLEDMIYTYIRITDLPVEWFSLFYDNSLVFEDGVIYVDQNTLDPNSLSYLSRENIDISVISGNIRAFRGNPKYDNLLY